MDTDLLNAKQVLASGNAAGDGDVVGGCVLLAVLSVSVSVMSLPLRSHEAWPPENVGPISLIFIQSEEPSAPEALETLLR